MLSKHKEKGDIKFNRPIYLNSTAETVITFNYGLYKSFKEILCRIDDWINEHLVG